VSVVSFRPRLGAEVSYAEVVGGRLRASAVARNRRMKVIYKITYPKREDLHWQGPHGQRQLLLERWQQVEADFTGEERGDFTIRKEIMWQSETATDTEVIEGSGAYPIPQVERSDGSRLPSSSL
jgi:hypothetical protein